MTDLAEAPVPMSKRALAIAAISASSAASLELAEAVRSDDFDRSISCSEIVQDLADALKMTLETIDDLDADQGQMLAACVRFLDVTS